jgi:hypothetical protein
MSLAKNFLHILLLIITSDSYSQEFKPSYTIDECIVKVELNWTADNLSEAHDVLIKADKFWKKAIAGGQFPLFFLHYTNAANYYMIYFAQKCEERKDIVTQIIQLKIKPNVPNFPNYEVFTSGFKVGFDGAMPSGWWIK